MADVAITKSKSITIRGGQIPSSPVIPETPEYPVVLPSTPPHNNLTGLQGGTSTERYHINVYQWDAVDGANAPDAGNPFATMADVGGGSDTNKVSYNVADGKTATEQQQARDNIGLDSGISQIVTTAANINNLARTNNLIVFTTAGSSYVLTGMVAGLEGERVTLVNKRSFNIQIDHLSGLSSSANQFSIGATYTMLPNEILTFYYDATSSKWVSDLNFLTKVLRKDVADTKTGQLTLDGQSDSAGAQLLLIENLSNEDVLTVSGSGVTTLFGTGSGTVGTLTVQQKSTGASSQTIRTVKDTGVISIALENQGTIFLSSRSTGASYSTRRDELPFNYPQTVATAGTINNLSLTDEGIKLLILTTATDLTGVVPVSTTTGRELKIEGRVGGGVIIRHESASSTAANRFTLPGAVDLTIANGEVYTFIYTNGRWRRAL